MMILDTSFIIDVLQGKEHAVKKLEELEERGVSQDITTVSLFELWSGIERSSRPEDEKRKVVEVLESRNIFNLDVASAEIAGKIDAKLMDEGNPVEPQDCMISGIAIHEGKTVLTADKSHFSQIHQVSELDIELS